jgi:hypothetical protein
MATEPDTTAPDTTMLATAVSVPSVDAKVYLLRDGRLVIAHRHVTGPAVLRGALAALLAGPSASEAAAGLTTEVPPATQLLDLALTNGQATVELTSPYRADGGTSALRARIAQVVFTATQFTNVERVTFRVDGTPLRDLGGGAVALTEPQTRAMIDRTITGSVIIDTPAPGATVHSPFTVTGEGFVYEGQFPIEVWSSGRQVGGMDNVSTGSWFSSWAPFQATITLDTPPGPIQLVAYDEGGCGTGPECPPVIKTVIPLTLAG